MKRVLGVDGALPGAISQKRAACQQRIQKKKLVIIYSLLISFILYFVKKNVFIFVSLKNGNLKLRHRS